MGNYHDREYLLEEQYNDASNLNARQELNRRFSTTDLDWYGWLFDHFDLPVDADVLELGCGPGDLWAENGERIPDGWTVTLSDLSPGMVQDARESLAEVDFSFAFEAFDAQEIPFAEGSFDAVVGNHMLYHTADLDETLAEIRRVLAPGGHLYASTNSTESGRELYDFVNDFQSGGATKQESANKFRLESGAAALESHFETVEVDTHVNRLSITDPDFLVTYVGSGLLKGDLDMEGFAEYTHERVSEETPLEVTKEVGVFIARADA